ncbi:MAG: hypothetical protein HYZ45_05440 [Burkholderiales bacterium]|nr:hypothetical protein [Burkholderiales bacterium]
MMDMDGEMGMSPKRVGPEVVTPLIIDGIRLEAVNAGRARGLSQNGGYLEAFDVASGKTLWLLQVYQIKYDQEMEEDVQDRFISKLVWQAQNKTVLVIDEFGKRYQLDLQNKIVQALP